MRIDQQACLAVAESFARLLADRAYQDAYQLTSRDYRVAITLDAMRESFELIVPLDWGDADPIEAVQSMDSWPGKQASDLTWVYISIGGDVYSEGLAVVITAEHDQPRIREVEFGRP